MPDYRFDGKKLLLSENAWKERLLPSSLKSYAKKGLSLPLVTSLPAGKKKASMCVQGATCLFLALKRSMTQVRVGLALHSLFAQKT